MRKNKFKQVHYVVQTKPLLKVCGYCFNLTEAEEIASVVKQITGVKGKIITFTRSELRRLNYQKPCN